jgi:hypothetical protein
MAISGLGNFWVISGFFVKNHELVDHFIFGSMDFSSKIIVCRCRDTATFLGFRGSIWSGIFLDVRSGVKSRQKSKIGHFNHWSDGSIVCHHLDTATSDLG